MQCTQSVWTQTSATTKRKKSINNNHLCVYQVEWCGQRLFFSSAHSASLFLFEFIIWLCCRRRYRLRIGITVRVIVLCACAWHLHSFRLTLSAPLRCLASFCQSTFALSGCGRSLTRTHTTKRILKMKITSGIICSIVSSNTGFNWSNGSNHR